MSQASEPDDPPSDADEADGNDQVRESPEGQKEEAGRGRSRGRGVDLNGGIDAPGERGEDEQPAAPLMPRMFARPAKPGPGVTI